MKTGILKNYPFYSFFIPVFFCLHGWATHYHFISAWEVFGIFKWVLLSQLICYFIIYAITKKSIYSALTTSIILAGYLYFGDFKMATNNIPYLGKFSFFLPIYFLLWLATLIFIKRKQDKLSGTNFYLNLLLIAFIVNDLIVIITKSRQTIALADIPINESSFNQSKKQNVYLLVFDEYAGLKSLRNRFNFDNSKFYADLKNSGFKIINTSSNYSYTPASIASLFNANYIDFLKDSGSFNWQEQQRCAALIKNAAVTKVFKAMGYKLNCHSLFEVEGSKHISISKFLLGHEKLLTHTMLHYVLFNTFGHHLLKYKATSHFAQRAFWGEFYDYNDIVEKKLLESLENKTNQPQFTYAHFLMPHYPFLYDSVGPKKELKQLQNDSLWRSEIKYISYLKYCNKKILVLSNQIRNKDLDAIVLLISDHGFRRTNEPMNQLNFDNFLAVYDRNGTANLPDSTSLLNVFPALLNGYFNQNIAYKPNVSIRLKEITE
jgi:hypothetical protein